MKLLVLSNGKGEDSLAVTLLNAIRDLSIERNVAPPLIHAFALVGSGEAYNRASFPATGTEEELPSKGFTGSTVTTFLKDIRSGLFGIIGKQIRTIRRLSKDADAIICIGDIYPVFLACLFTNKPLIHLATAISVNYRKYNFLELRLFRKRCKVVFTRDRATADFLVSNNVNAEYHGNLMMDDPNIISKGIDFGIPKEKKVIGLIPSTRQDAYDNIDKMLIIISEMKAPQNIEFLLSFSPHLNIDIIKVRVKEAGWDFLKYHPSFGEMERIGKNGICVRVISSSFGDIIRRSDLLIGMTGTGNEQAVGLGTPVVLVECGPAASRQRIEQYQKILGDAVAAPRGTEKQAAEYIENLLNDKEWLQVMAEAGMERMGSPGASRKIADRILEITK